MLGRQVQDLRRSRIAKQRPPLGASLQSLGDPGDGPPAGHETADLETPVGLEMIHHPIVTRHRGPWASNVGPMCGPIDPGAGVPQGPPEVARWHHACGPSRPYAMAARLLLAFFWLPRVHGLGGRAALQPLPTRFFIGADDEASLLGEAPRLDSELTEVLRLGLTIWIVAVEPGDAPMRLEVGLLQETPAAGATHGPPPRRRERRAQVGETPPGGGTMRRGRFPGRSREPLHARRGGNAPRAARARGLPQAGETVRQITLTPTADRPALPGPLGGSLEMRWAGWRSSPEEQPTAKGESLGRGMGSYKRRQTGVFLKREGYRARQRHRHGH
jgi:hypothetical protein